MSELLPVITAPLNITNDQRHDAALTIAEHTDTPEVIGMLLSMVGLAQPDVDGGFSAIGTDEFEIPWFTPALRSPDAAAR